MIASNELVMMLDDEFFSATPESLACVEKLRVTSDYISDDINLELFKQQIVFCSKLKKLDFNGFLSENISNPNSELFLKVMVSIQEVIPIIEELDLSENMLHEHEEKFLMVLSNVLASWSNLRNLNLSANSLLTIVECKCETEPQKILKSKAVFNILRNCPKLVELDLSQELIVGRIPACEWIDKDIIAILQEISLLCPNLQTLAIRNCPFKYLRVTL